MKNMLTLHSGGDDRILAVVEEKDKKVSVTYAEADTLRKALEYTIEHGIYARRYKKIPPDGDDDLILIESNAGDENFLDSLKLYLELSFDYKCFIARSVVEL